MGEGEAPAPDTTASAGGGDDGLVDYDPVGEQTLSLIHI